MVWLRNLVGFYLDRIQIKSIAFTANVCSTLEVVSLDVFDFFGAAPRCALQLPSAVTAVRRGQAKATAAFARPQVQAGGAQEQGG